jgi:rubrerythrin
MDHIEFEHIFSVAVEREIEAHEFYQQVSERVEHDDVKEVFQQLAKEEMGHKELLERFRFDPTMIMKIQAPPADYKIAEATELPTLSIDMKPADAVALAMKKEQQAVEFYRDLAVRSSDHGTKAIFENLANIELGHKHRLENVFVEIGYPEVF